MGSHNAEIRGGIPRPRHSYHIARSTNPTPIGGVAWKTGNRKWKSRPDVGNPESSDAERFASKFIA